MGGALVGGAVMGGALVGGGVMGGALIGGVVMGGALVGGALVGGALVGGAPKGGTKLGPNIDILLVGQICKDHWKGLLPVVGVELLFFGLGLPMPPMPPKPPKPPERKLEVTSTSMPVVMLWSA